MKLDVSPKAVRLISIIAAIQLKGLSSKSFWLREVYSCIWSMLCNINLYLKKKKEEAGGSS